MKNSCPDREKANELENTITSVADSSEDGVAELGNILRDASYGMLMVPKLYDKVDFKETAIALDPNHEASIFAKGADGKLLKRTC
jgi:hypothetical protein